jgi:hypothetical protein
MYLHERGGASKPWRPLTGSGAFYFARNLQEDLRLPGLIEPNIP